ncbi:crotonase/enoyl-CoA hydratase family protein [Methylocystis sp. 9N]|uniref:Crotonase/enoyl-CoA hydratase family protein n=1 Tax=Methylocystis borbori TaxID=3118750 RepID=A0ABU7XDW4_9HYPH
MVEAAGAGTACRSKVLTECEGSVRIITINRPAVRNAVDAETAEALAAEFSAFERDAAACAAVLTGAAGTFCAGADLKEIASNGAQDRWSKSENPPMGATRLALTKPVIAAIEGHAVAGGLELAIWCDLRVASETAVFGVFNRRWNLPLVDGGTVRLPRMIGQSRALDMIVTARPVDAREALAIGLVNRVVPAGSARAEAIKLAHSVASLPAAALKLDRMAVLRQWSLREEDALDCEFSEGISLASDHQA